MTSSLTSAQACVARVAAQINKVVVGNPRTVRHLLAAFFTHGHVLLEDFPGTGKTTLAKALAASIGSRFKRIQCTPDLLPSDILGVSIFNPKSNEFELHRGPIFTEILLADEINRASPRTQSALLEAMAERQVSLDNTTHPLASTFFVIATQNPIELQGTYPLPEAQLDRFAMCLTLGYLSEAAEVEMIETLHLGRLQPPLTACIDTAEIAAVTRAIHAIPIAPELVRYAVSVVNATRHAADVALGASPRASLNLVACAKALALFDGVGFVTPDHLQELAVPVIAHRISLAPNARFQHLNGTTLVQKLLTELAVPQ